jgi:ring-1,2-phenylacetyl-CoA epoxidase subunit PaaD
VNRPPDAATIREWLREVMDPEIPSLSVLDLGIVREIHVSEAGVQVEITPTYSGCPAMLEIERAIERALTFRGVGSVAVTRVWREPWTTEWLTETGRQALSQAGIAPPPRIAATSLPAAAPACPVCGSSQTRVQSPFGSTACKALRVCRSCGEPFEAFKPV